MKQFHLQEAWQLPNGEYTKPHWDRWYNAENRYVIPEEEVEDHLKDVGRWQVIDDKKSGISEGDMVCVRGVEPWTPCEVLLVRGDYVQVKEGDSEKRYFWKEIIQLPLARRIAETRELCAGPLKPVVVDAYITYRHTYFVSVPKHVNDIAEISQYVKDVNLLDDAESKPSHVEKIGDHQISYVRAPTVEEMQSHTFNPIPLDTSFIGWSKDYSDQDKVDEEAKETIRKHYDDISSEILYVSRVDIHDNDGIPRENLSLNPPVPMRINVVGGFGKPIISKDANGDWWDSRYCVSPLFDDPRLKGHTSLSVMGISVQRKYIGKRLPLFTNDEHPDFKVIPHGPAEA